MRTVCISLILLAWSLCFSARMQAAQAGVRDRLTVLVYMNAQNDLDCYAVANVQQMQSALPLNNVSVVVELGRSRTAEDCPGEDAGNRWDGTLFFKLAKGMILRPRDALPDAPEPVKPGSSAANVDMGDWKSLRKFVIWAEHRYPAEHYILIIWGHSRGYRLTNLALYGTGVHIPVLPNGYRVLSVDSAHNSSMYTHDLRVALHGTKVLDVLGFDSCLMAGIETAYALSGLARVMVGSEELESFNGWDYARVLRSMSRARNRSAYSLGSLIVNAARNTPHGPDTLSAIDLTKIPRVANQLSILADAMIDGLLNPQTSSTVRSKIDGIRGDFENYGEADGFHNPIDLVNLLRRLRTESPTKEIAGAASQVLRSFEKGKIIFDNHVTAGMEDDLRSSGLTIYFPADVSTYNHDPDDHDEGYTTCICDEPEKHPVDFVCQLDWSSFLHVYFTQGPGTKQAVAEKQ